MRSAAPPHARRVVAAALGVAILVGMSASAMPTTASDELGLARTAPRPPVNLQVSTRDTVALVTWSQPEPAAIEVEISPNRDFSTVRTATSSRGLVVFESLTADTMYYVRARPELPAGSASSDSPGLPDPAVDDQDTRASTMTSFTTSKAAYPHPRSVVSSDSKTSDSLLVEWTEYLDGYDYEWQFDAESSFAAAETGVADANHLEFDGLEADTTYFFRVRTLDSAGTPLSDWSKTTKVVTAKSLPLRVATYNIQKASGNGWAKRRRAVANLILSQDPDVVGLQEAENKPTSGKATQYYDLIRLLGPNWEVTNNSRRSTGDVRTIYNADRVKLIEQGYSPLQGSRKFGGQRYVTWARFQQKSTGKEFLFVNTHFVWQYNKKAYAARASQARQLLQIVERANPDDLPIVLGGDFNTHERRDGGNTVYRILTGGGYVDPLRPEQELGSAESLVNANLHTYTGAKSKANRARSVSRTTMIDHMMVSGMRVAEWETAARLNSADRFVGPRPSDHNMIRMTVYLP
jgi:endonuclease/exonuclease/phosphatase family metal-dependent hydrolase